MQLWTKQLNYFGYGTFAVVKCGQQSTDDRSLFITLGVQMDVVQQSRLILDRVAGEIIRLVASVCACVRLLWALSCLNRLTFDLDFWHDGWS